MRPPSVRWPMLKVGNLYYQVRALSRECGRGVDHGECDGPFFLRQLVALCTCDCHEYNRAGYCGEECRTAARRRRWAEYRDRTGAG